MSDPAILQVIQSNGLQPRRLRLFSTSMEELGEAMLGAEYSAAQFDVPQGDYLLQIEQMGLPNQHLGVRALKGGSVVSLEALRPPSQPPPVRRRRRGKRQEFEGDTTAPTIPADVPDVPEGAALLPTDSESSLQRRRRGRRSAEASPEGLELHPEMFGLQAEIASQSDEGGLVVRGPDVLATNFAPEVLKPLRRPDADGQARLQQSPRFVEPSPFGEEALIFLPVFAGEFRIERRGSAFAVSHRNYGWDARSPVVPALLAFIDRDRTEGGDQFVGMALGEPDTAANDYDGDAGSALETVAHNLLRDKFFDPYQAALAGHFLLRHSKFELLRDWTRNLADYFPYLSDGLVLEGWRRLSVTGGKFNQAWPKWRQNDPPPATHYNPKPNAPRPDNPVEDAAARFIEAMHRGLPNFEFGCRKLLEGLVFCYDNLRKDSPRRDRVAGFATDLARKLEQVTSTAGLTTLHRD